MLLNNDADATSIPANAAQFTMHTDVAYGLPYDVAVGTQPYGISLACTPSSNSGTASANVSTVSISCATVAPLQKAIETHLTFPEGVAVDATGGVFVLDGDMVKAFPYRNGSYDEPVIIWSGTSLLNGVAVDTSGNLYVTDTSNETVKKIPFGNGAYGAPVTLASGFTDPSGVAVDAAGNVYVADAGRVAVPHYPAVPGSVTKIPYSNGSYGPPVSVGSGFTQSTGVAVDAAGNVYVAQQGSTLPLPVVNGDVMEIPYSNGSYGAPVSIGSGFTYPSGVAVDAAGNVYVVDYGNEALMEIRAGGTSVQTLSSGFRGPNCVAVDSTGNVYVSDQIALKKIPAGNAAAQTLSPAYGPPLNVAVDASGNVYGAAGDSDAAFELPYSNGTYATPVSLGSGLIYPTGVAVDASGNVYVSTYDNSSNSTVVQKVPSGGGPLQTVASGFSGGNSVGVAVDAAGNVYVADSGNNAVEEIPYNNGTYATPVALGSGFHNPMGVAVDASGSVYVADTYNGAVKKIPAGGGAIQTISLAAVPFGVAVDATGNIFVADPGGNEVLEIPYSNGTYGAPMTVGSGFLNPTGVAVDRNGRLYVTDNNAFWLLLP